MHNPFLPLPSDLLSDLRSYMKNFLLLPLLHLPFLIPFATPAHTILYLDIDVISLQAFP